MAKLTTDQLIDAFKELSLIELSEFVKKFEEVFEVTAAAPVAVAAAPAAGAAAGHASTGSGQVFVIKRDPHKGLGQHPVGIRSVGTAAIGAHQAI